MASIKKCNDNVKCFCVARNMKSACSHQADIRGYLHHLLKLDDNKYELQAVIRLDASGLSRRYPLTFIKLDDKLASVVSTMHQLFQLTDI